MDVHDLWYLNEFPLIETTKHKYHTEDEETKRKLLPRKGNSGGNSNEDRNTNYQTVFAACRQL